MIGFELSELLQNSFKNTGLSNFTFYSGFESQKHLNLSFIGINVDLSSEHLKTNPFIEGEKDSLKGKLTTIRFYYDFSVKPFKISFLKIKPVLGAGLGYTKTQIGKNTQEKAENTGEYISKNFSLNIFPRIRTYLFEYIFVEFPCADMYLNLWTNPDKVKEFDGTIIKYPDYFGIYLWINIGINLKI